MSDDPETLNARQERVIDELRTAITRLVHGRTERVLSVTACLAALENREQLLKRELDCIVTASERVINAFTVDAEATFVLNECGLIEQVARLRQAINGDAP